MWNTHFGRAWMWDLLFLYARISCMVLTSSFGIIHANGLHHSLELSALTEESPCSKRKVYTISRVAFQAQTGIWKRAQGPLAPALAGAPGVTSPFRDFILALLHIIMTIQLPMLDDDILGELDKHFEAMYANADEAISLGLRKNHWIPKLMALAHFVKILSWVVSQAIGVL